MNVGKRDITVYLLVGRQGEHLAFKQSFICLERGANDGLSDASTTPSFLASLKCRMISERELTFTFAV